MTDEHCDDLWNVREGDRVTLTTDQGDITADCTDRVTNHSAENTGEVTETTIWTFETDGMDGTATIHAAITNGMKSVAIDTDFPDHSALWNSTAEQNVGYITELKIHGKME